MPAIILYCDVFLEHHVRSVASNRMIREQPHESRKGDWTILSEEADLIELIFCFCNLIYLGLLLLAEVFSQLSAELRGVDEIKEELVCIQMLVLNNQEAR